MDSESILNRQVSAEEQKWERSWTTDEIRSNSVKWTLAGDIGLFHLLNDFSQKIISRTHEIENEVDTLVHKTKIASVKISNVINDFHMLSNLQFVENRVYDEEVQDSTVQEKQVPEKTKEQKEAEMLPKVIKAIELGLSVLDQAFDKINVDDISDSEDEEDLSSEGRTILEPKDPYEFRSLPYIIGSEEFQNDDFAGLGELCEEEVAEVSAEDQTLSESESSSEEEEPVPMVDNRFDDIPDSRLRAESISDKLSSSDESELFGSEKEENEFLPDLTIDAKKNQVDQVLKSHVENTEKDTRHNSVSSIQSRLKLPQVLPTPKKEQNSKDEVDLFANEDISDDESPFRKKTSLFKSEVNFDNDDQDMFNDDLFGEKVKKETISPLPFEKPITHKESDYSAAKDIKDSALFGTDDSEDDMFSTLPKAKPLHVAKPVKKEKQETTEKSAKVIKSTSPILPAKSEKAFNFKDDSSNSLFGDDSDADDLFLGTKSQKKFNFDAANDDDDLFGLVNDKTSIVSKEKDKPRVLSPKSQKTEKDFTLFDDSSTFDQPDQTEDKPTHAVKIPSKTPKLFSDSDSSDLPDKTKDKPVHTAKIPSKTPKLFGDSDSSDLEIMEEIKPAPSSAKKIDSLFDNEDIFNKEPSKPKPVKSLLADKDDDFSLFDDKKTPVVPQAKQQSKSAKSLFEESDNFDLFSSKDPIVEEPPLKKSENFQASKTAVSSKLTFEKSIDVSNAPNIADKNKPSKVETPKQIDSTEISFDVPVDTSNTLNIVGKDRAKVSAKRRKPTRKGRLAALQSGDSNAAYLEADEPSPSVSNSNQKISNNLLTQAARSEEITSATDPISRSPEKTSTHKEKEKQKKDLMSQLMSEVTASKVKRSTVLLEDSDDEVDLFSSKPRASSSKSDFSFLSPVENVESSKVSSEADQNSDTKSEESAVLPTESADNEDFFTEPSFQGFRTSISHKASILDFDDDDDDLFKNIQDNPLPKEKDSNPANGSPDIFSNDADDIFAGLQKEKYEMFPSQLYDADDDDGDIFGSSEKSVVEKVTNNTSSKPSVSAIKKEPEKKPVNLFDDPLTGLLQD